VKTKLIKIGNSRGVRLPKSLIEQMGLRDEVELNVEGDRIVIRGVREPRAGWEAAARLMAQRGDDAMLDDPLPSLTSFDDEEWEW
jgi:antitoxin MazE